MTDRWFFDYDAASNRTSNQHGNVVQTAQHNNLNQLTATVGGGKTRFVGQLNEAGKACVAGAEVPSQSDNSFETNLDLAPGTHTVSVEAEDGSGNHASKQYQIDVQAGASATFTHDTNGNLLTDGNRTYTWDPRNRLKSPAVGGVVYSWEYDGLDRRISEKVNGTLTRATVASAFPSGSLGTTWITRRWRCLLPFWDNQRCFPGIQALESARHLGCIVGRA